MVSWVLLDRKKPSLSGWICKLDLHQSGNPWKYYNPILSTRYIDGIFTNPLSDFLLLGHCERNPLGQFNQPNLSKISRAEGTVSQLDHKDGSFVLMAILRLEAKVNIFLLGGKMVFLSNKNMGLLYRYVTCLPFLVKMKTFYTLGRFRYRYYVLLSYGLKSPKFTAGLGGFCISLYRFSLNKPIQ